MARMNYVPTQTTQPPKARAKRTTTAKPAPETIHAADTEPDTASWFAKMQESVDGFLKSIKAPSWTRLAVSTMLGLITTGSVVYFSMQLIEMLVVAVMTYTGIGFISFMVTFITMFLTIMSAVTAGNAVFDFCMEFDYSNVKARVLNFFKRDTKEPAHA